GVALVALTLVLRRPPPARAPSLAEAPELL
ncbi:MAG: hypothetical protein QOE57_3633, partial [Acidimicrobiaceae bacterium]|nr:hypothetical protein [Acidimicrobiaceae bacterium]